MTLNMFFRLLLYREYIEIIVEEESIKIRANALANPRGPPNKKKELNYRLHNSDKRFLSFIDCLSDLKGTNALFFNNVLMISVM